MFHTSRRKTVAANRALRDRVSQGLIGFVGHFTDSCLSEFHKMNCVCVSDNCAMPLRVTIVET